MRVIIVIKSENATVHVPGVGNQTGHMYKVKRHGYEDGVYRGQATFDSNLQEYYTYVGKKVDRRAEAERLRKLAEADYLPARTTKPGVAGYQHMEDMSRASQEAEKERSRALARILDVLEVP